MSAQKQNGTQVIWKNQPALAGSNFLGMMGSMIGSKVSNRIMLTEPIIRVSPKPNPLKLPMNRLNK